MPPWKGILLVVQTVYVLEAVASAVFVVLVLALGLPAGDSRWVYPVLALRTLRAGMVLIKSSPSNRLRVFAVQDLPEGIAPAEVIALQITLVLLLQLLWYSGLGTERAVPWQTSISGEHCTVDVCIFLLELTTLIHQLQSDARQLRGAARLAAMGREFKVDAWSTLDCCIICLEDFHPGEDAVELKCGHVYHRECIWLWILKGAGTCAMRCGPATAAKPARAVTVASV